MKYYIATMVFPNFKAVTKYLRDLKNKETLTAQDKTLILEVFGSCGIDVARAHDVILGQPKHADQWGRKVFAARFASADGYGRTEELSVSNLKAGGYTASRQARFHKNFLKVYNDTTEECPCGGIVAKDMTDYIIFQNYKAAVCKLCPPLRNLQLDIQKKCNARIKVFGWKISNTEAGDLIIQGPVEIVPEPTNPTDENALMVMVGETHVAYVARDSQQVATVHLGKQWKFAGYNPNATVIYLGL
jgi:hypothetical protein